MRLAGGGGGPGRAAIAGGRVGNCSGQIFRHDGVADQLCLPGVVPRREVRHLGALGAAGRADGGRLVCAQDVSARLGGLQGSPGALRPSVHERLEGHHSALESREVGPGEVDGALQKGRREIFRQHGLAPRRFFPVEFDAAQMERRQLRAAPRRGGRMAEGGEEERPALRRFRTSRRELHLVSGRAQVRQDRPAGRRAV